MADETAAGGRRGQLASSASRPGWTTGACAAAAARAAYVGLRTGEPLDPVRVSLPGGRTPAFALTAYDGGEGWAMAAVTKDAGDDPDVTHGAVVRVVVRHNPPGAGVTFAAGPGVGTVTLPGLPVAVGEPAINPAPRRMIADNLAEAAAALRLAADPGARPQKVDAHVEVGIDRGEQLARHTLNPRLGVVGGLSVLGTTGVVIPYSCSAWIDSIRRGIDVARALGVRHVAACTGSTSEQTARQMHRLPDVALVDMGDFAGAVLTCLRDRPIPRLTLCGGVGKLAKLADGHLDLHSSRSRVDTAFLAGLVAQAGAADGTVAAVAQSATALGALEAADRAGVPLGALIAAAARAQALRVLRGAPVDVDVVCIDRSGRVVGHAASGPS